MSATNNQQFFAPQEDARGFSAIDVVKASIGTAIIAAILACIYGPVIFYSPIIYLNILLAYGLGWATGRFAANMLRRFRIDSKVVATLVGLVGGVVAVWASWATYLVAASEFDFTFLKIALNPLTLFDVIQYIAHNPIWTFRKSSSAGPAVMYYAFWVIEFGLIVFMAVQGCRTFINNNKLCGRCKKWVKPTGETVLFDIPEGLDVATPLQAGDLSILPTLPRLADDAPMEVGKRWLVAGCYACGTCEDQNAQVTVALLTLQLDKNKKPQTVSTILANLAEIDPELEKAIFDQTAIPTTTPEEPSQPAQFAEDDDQLETDGHSDESGRDQNTAR